MTLSQSQPREMKIKPEFEEVFCIFCGNTASKTRILQAPDRLNNFPGTFYLSRCDNCGLIFQDPRPTEESMKYYYPDDLGYYQPTSADLPAWRQTLRTQMLINHYGYNHLGRKSLVAKIITYPLYVFVSRHRAIPKYKPNGTVLEIGCSTGTLLKDLRELGWNTTGLEPNEKAANHAKSIEGLNVHNSIVSQADFPKESFDVIILEMVLEHLHEPDLAIKKINTWLKKGGQLIFSIPYIKGFEYSHYKQYAYGLHFPNHLTFFDKNTLEKLLGNNFKDIRYVFQHFDRDMVASAQFAYVDKKGLTNKLIGYNRLLRLVIIKPLVLFLSLMGKTSRVTVFATKR